MTLRLMTVPAKLTFAVAASLLLSGCVSLTPDMVYPLGSMPQLSESYIASPGQAEEESIRTAKSGDILFRQTIQNAHVLELQNTIAPVGNISLSVQERQVSFQKGEKFYGGVNIGEYPAFVACSKGRPAVHIPRLNPGAKGSGKVCFELKKIEGEIDRDALQMDWEDQTSDKFFFVTDGMYALTEAGTSYQSLARWDPQFLYTVSPPAEFRLIEDATGPTENAPEIGLRFVQTAEGDFLETVYQVDSQPVLTRTEPTKIDTTKGFPMTIGTDGAVVELLALKDGVLAYRVLSGFTSGKSHLIDLPE